MAKPKYKTEVISTYDPWITVKKFLTGLGMTIIPVILLYTIDFLQTEEFPPEYVWIIPLFVAIIHAILNFVKHWDDTEFIEVKI